jgi:Tfp pilus assembly protein PilW
VRRNAIRIGERGSAVVEFALLLPIVFLVLLAVVQVGVLASDQLVITEAARAGARDLLGNKFRSGKKRRCFKGGAVPITLPYEGQQSTREGDTRCLMTLMTRTLRRTGSLASVA